MRRVLNPLRNPLAAFCVMSHKVLRYLTFVFLIMAFATSSVLALSSAPFRLLWELEVLALALAAIGLLRGLPSFVRRVTGLPSYFLVSNVAFALAAVRFLRGDAMATWRPRGG
jgi:hypothetical protein